MNYQRVGLIVPTEDESNGLYRSTINRFHAYRIPGIGKVRAISACSELIHLAGCNSIVLFGFAGGLRGLNVGTVIEPDIYVEGDLDARIIRYPYPNIINMAKELDIKKIIDKSIVCPIITQDSFLTTNPYDFKYSKMACDMESYACAYFCHDNLIPFRAIKVISDVVGLGKNSVAYSRAAKKLNETLNHVLDEVSLCLT